MIKNRLLNWFFYGHILIAVAAAGLAWLSIQLVYGPQTWINEWPIITFLFFATLGIYTLHRYLSFQRAGIRPTTFRYNIIARHPAASLWIGMGSLIAAMVIGLPFLKYMWITLLWATPLTVFYLTPPIKGWRRLRDLPYVKVIWVGWAWALMTHLIPVQVASAQINEAYLSSGDMIGLVNPASATPLYSFEFISRFLFTASIALLFDFRDTILDRSQGVKTVANTNPLLARLIVTTAMLICAFIASWTDYCIIDYQQTLIPLTYLAIISVAWATHDNRSEHWYAVVVNGLLLGPVVAMMVSIYLG